MEKRKKLLVTVILLLSPWFVSLAHELGKPKALNVFIVGNSFSRDAAFFLPAIAREKGFALVLEKAEIGGGSLEQHWQAVVAHELNSLSPAGRPYNGKSLKMLLSKGKWDVVTMQQYSYLSPNINTYRPFAQNLYDYIKKLQPEAAIMLHQTWAYRSDAPRFGLVDEKNHSSGQQEMWQKSRAAYQTIARELKVRVIPTGNAFWTIDSHRKVGYKKDPAFNFSNPVFQQMPDQQHSLHSGYFWDNNRKLAIDANHASNAGRYLGALVWYAALFDESPKDIKFRPESISKTFAKKLKRAAARAVKKY